MTYLINIFCGQPWGQIERFTSLALLHIHPDMAPDANVLQKFDASGHRRIFVVFGD